MIEMGRAIEAELKPPGARPIITFILYYNIPICYRVLYGHFRTDVVFPRGTDQGYMHEGLYGISVAV